MKKSCGSEGEGRLRLPGSNLNGIFSAGAFVRFYNAGLVPEDFENFSFHKSDKKRGRKVAVIGHGK